MTFGEKVRELRKQAGLSQSELGTAVEVTLRTVRGWEVEGRYPKKHATYAKLAEVLGCRISYLLTEDESFSEGYLEETESVISRQSRQILRQLEAIFASHKLTDEEKFALVTEIQVLYLNTRSRRF